MFHLGIFQIYFLGLLATGAAFGYLFRGKPYAQHWRQITWGMALWPAALPLVLAWLLLIEVRRRAPE